MNMINDNTTLPPSYYDSAWTQTTKDHGTGHMSIIAPNGDCVALTSTINT